MTGTNLELVRSICEAWGRGDYRSNDWAHPDIEFVIADGPAPGSWTGLDGMADGWRTWLGAWDGFEQEAEEHRELDDERVLVFFRGHGRAKSSGVDIAELYGRAAGVFHIRDGRVTRFAVYLGGERALAELGIEE
jgi:ketosteroid isomerase-like protein